MGRRRPGALPQDLPLHGLSRPAGRRRAALGHPRTTPTSPSPRRWSARPRPLGRARRCGSASPSRKARTTWPTGSWTSTRRAPLVALQAILERIELDLRAAPIEAGLRLGLAHALLPASRLHSYPGRVGALRIVNGTVRLPGDRQWRERNPWLLFEDGCRLVRGFIQRLEASPGGPLQARLGDDLQALVEGAANVALRRGSAALPGQVTVADRTAPGRNRVRLVLSQPPVRWSTETLSFAYLATSIVLGREAASAARPASRSSRRSPGPSGAGRRRPCGEAWPPWCPCWRPTRAPSCCSRRGRRRAWSPACWAASGRAMPSPRRCSPRVRTATRASSSSRRRAPPSPGARGPVPTCPCHRWTRRSRRPERSAWPTSRRPRPRWPWRSSRRVVSRPVSSGCWARCWSAWTAAATCDASSARGRSARRRPAAHGPPRPWGCSARPGRHRSRRRRRSPGTWPRRRLPARAGGRRATRRSRRGAATRWACSST